VCKHIAVSQVINKEPKGNPFYLFIVFCNSNFEYYFLPKNNNMKRTIFIALLLVAVSSYAHTYVFSSLVTKVSDIKHISSSQVPTPVIANFNSMFPSATNVKWDIITGAYAGNTQYMAEFRLNGAKRTARYSPDGTYLGGS
jgi:hypothetical protein